MGSNRLSFTDERAVTSAPGGAGFMAVPAVLLGVMDAATFQRQLYQWAFEQAQQATQASRPAPMRDLFAIMN
jgi:hypothetical protein